MQWDTITERIASKVEPGDGIIFCPGWFDFWGIEPYRAEHGLTDLKVYKWKGSKGLLPGTYVQHDRLWVYVDPRRCDIDTVRTLLQEWDQETDKEYLRNEANKFSKQFNIPLRRYVPAGLVDIPSAAKESTFIYGVER